MNSMQTNRNLCYEGNLLEEYQNILGRNKLPQVVKDRIWDQAWERVAAQQSQQLSLTQTTTQSPFSFLRRLSWQMMAATLVITLLFSSGGMVLVAQQSLPGEDIYSFKRGLEEVWWQLTPSIYRDDLQMTFLDRRIREVSCLLEAGLSVPEATLAEIVASFEEMQENPEVWAHENVQARIAVQLLHMQEIANLYPQTQELTQIYWAAAGTYTCLGGNLSSLTLSASFLTPTSTATPTPTSTPVPTFTATPTSTPVPTLTPTTTFTPEATLTPTLQPSKTPTQVVTPISPTATPGSSEDPGGSDSPDDPDNPDQPDQPDHPDHPDHPPQDPNPPSPPGRDKKDKG